MSDKISFTNIDNSENLYSILKDCAHHTSIDSLTDDFDYGSSVKEYSSPDCFKMISVSDAFGENVLEEDGRISLAYEDLRSIPKKIAEKFASQTKCLDLSYNNFENLSFLTFFNRLHTLILDRNPNLDINSLPLLPSLRILWINNCNINKMDECLYRVQDQCPNLQQLSIMGNKEALLLQSESSNSDHRECIFNMFPNLTHLNGGPRVPLDNGPMRVAPSVSLIRDSSRVHHSSSSSNKKSISTIKFSELFVFKRRKKYPHSTATT